MAVGDIVERDDQYYVCVPVGWQEIELVAPDGGTDDLTALAASYHRDKLARTVDYPLPYTSSEQGRIWTASFDYFPEHHYQRGFEQLRGTVSDDLLAEWIDDVIGTEPTGATHGGL